MLTDTHAHLYYPDILDSLPEILRRAEEAGIGRVIVPAVNLETSLKILDLSKEYEQIYCALGLHPCDVSKSNPNEINEIEKLLSHKKVVAVGETGLDYYWDTSNIEQQKDLFRKQIRIASKLKLPVIVHTRDSTDDAITLMKEEYEQYPVRAHFHCFSGTLAQLSECLSIPDSHISFCGNITYKKSLLDDVISAAPIDRLLSETDSPFLPPMPYRGKKNEPSFMIKTLEKISNVKGIPETELMNVVSKNAEKFFALQ
ncbi:MAG: TatD family hydrolase [Ignavibacteria bacterium]|nr:TatD family hydrolase [Ignavibacteria bacterium]